MARYLNSLRSHLPARTAHDVCSFGPYHCHDEAVPASPRRSRLAKTAGLR
jgi:hypothetical protein